MQISGYVPCFNNRATVMLSVRSLQEQSPSPQEVFAIDDGSTDGSAEWLESHGIRVVRNGCNLGRGATRALAMQEAKGELVISCDATNRLHATFLHDALPWFEEPSTAAVFGRLTEVEGGTVANRWRARHLFKTQDTSLLRHRALLATWGVVMRKSTALAVGNFDCRLRHTEDAELGTRLLAAGYDVIFDPNLRVSCVAKNTVAQVFERYWRWNAGKDEAVSWSGYAKQVRYSLKVMCRQDIAAGDPLSAFLSFLVPHYQFWRSGVRRIRSEPARILTERGAEHSSLSRNGSQSRIS